MKKILFCCIFISLFCVSTYSQKLKNENFIGVFQSCDGVHCSTYRINSDFTFEHKFHGEIKSGTWKFSGKNKIKIFAPGVKKQTVMIPTKKQNDCKTVYVKATLPKIPDFKETFIFQQNSICTIDKKGKAEFCYKKVEK